jgi:hypothetical protein
VAALVLLFHSWFLISGATRNIRQIPIINQGQVGVQLFMVISGFILAIISCDKELSALRFYLNRALRLYPLFRCRDNACATTPERTAMARCCRRDCSTVCCRGATVAHHLVKERLASAVNSPNARRGFPML